MNVSFPSRFLQKLNIYQQVRSGQGISKYKRLWKHEAAYLQAAYEGDHQHLNNFQSKRALKEWVYKYSNPGKDLDHVIGNLFYRGYLEIRYGSEKQMKAALLDRQTSAFQDKIIANTSFDDGDTIFRITPSGLLVGEVLSEINNKNKILKFVNRYRYSLVIDLLWLVAFWGLAQLFFQNHIVKLDQLLSPIIPFWLTWVGAPSFIFIGWPFITFVGRRIYKCLENDA